MTDTAIDQTTTTAATTATPTASETTGAGASILNQAPKQDANAWWANQDMKIDDDVRQFYAGRNTPSLEEALKLGEQSFKRLHERNVLPKPTLDKLSEWEGWSELGWKDKIDDYDLKKPEGLPESYPFSDELHTDIKTAAHKYKIPPAMAQGLINEVFANEVKRFNALDAQLAQQETNAKIEAERRQGELTGQLKAMWGEQYNTNLNLAQRAARQYATPEQLEKVAQVLGGDAQLVKLFADVGQTLGEDRLVSVSGNSYQNAISLNAQIDQLKGDANFMLALGDPSHVMHKTNSARWSDLLMKAAQAR